MCGTVGGEFQLRKTPVNHRSFTITAATTRVVQAGVTTDEAAGIESGSSNFSLTFVVALESTSQQTTNTLRGEQATRSFLQGCKMRDLGKPECRAEIVAIL